MEKGKLLKIYLYSFGLINIIFVTFVVPLVFGDQLLWLPRNTPDEAMISGLYFTMGVMMILAAKNPLEHKSLVDFIILANVIHGAIMFYFAENFLHVIIDVSSMLLMGLLPLVFYPWGLKNLFRYNKG